jgi:hypothetical protein
VKCSEALIGDLRLFLSDLHPRGGFVVKFRS